MRPLAISARGYRNRDSGFGSMFWLGPLCGCIRLWERSKAAWQACWFFRKTCGFAGAEESFGINVTALAMRARLEQSK